MSSRAELFSFARNTVLRAGAGTGKTEALTTVYLHLVSGLADGAVWPRQGLLPEKIVALTFTEKAAIEMRERIAEAVSLLSFEPLPRALESHDAGARERAARQWGQSRGLSHAAVNRVLALADAAVQLGRAMPGPEAWQRVGFALSRARIGTFHSFAAGVLRAAGPDLGLAPGFTVVDQEVADRLLREATVAALSSAARADVETVADLMATAGGIDAEGDRGLVARLAELVRALDESGAPDDALGARRVLEAPGLEVYVARDVLGRFARACEAIPSMRDDGTAVRMFALATRLAALPAVRTPEQARQCMQILAAHPLPGRNRTQRFESLAEEARFAYESLNDQCLAALSGRMAERARDVIVDARRRFRAIKRRRNALDFADLMRLLRDALRDRPALRRQWKRRFDAVLVDEFQDTNRVQRDLLYLLRERRDHERDIPAGRSLGAHEIEPAGLLLVGDAKQSIYAFRGADVAVFFEAEREIGLAGGARLELTESHRSLDTVIEAINPATEALLGKGLIAHAEGMYERRRDALSAESQGDGRVRVELMHVEPGNANAVRASEAQAIARRIRALVDATGPHDEGFRAPRYDEIAVLVPSWSHLDPIKRAFKEAAIPYALLGGPGFWDRREVDDLIVLLRFAADPSDRLALASVLRGPLVGVSDAALAHLFARPASLDEVLDPPAALRLLLAEPDRARLDEARPTLRRLVRFGATLGPEQALRLALTERAYAAVLATLPEGAQKVANVDKLLGLAVAAERRGGEEATVHGFVRYVDRMRAASQHETEADVSDVATGAVQVLSVHAAKGLEWPVVFVAQTSRRRRTHAERILLDGQGSVVALPAGFVAPDSFRDLRRDVHAAEDDDQRRLLYVALTRARDLLVVSGPAADGEGEWLSLSAALRAQIPARVRLVGRGEAGLAVPVRAGAGEEREASPAGELLAHAIEAPAMPRRRLLLAPAALAEFDRCPRRYLSLHEMGLGESMTAGPTRADVLASVRAIMARVDLARLADDPGGALAAAEGAASGTAPAAALGRARGLLEAFASGAGEGVLREPGAIVARALPLGVVLGAGDRAVTLHGRADLLVDGAALGREGTVLIQYAVLDEGDAATPAHTLELCAWALAFSRRLREAGGAGAAGPVHAALLALGEGGARWEFVPSERWEEAALTARVQDLGDALVAARADDAWGARARAQCERMRCGFVDRCHG